MVIYIAYSTNDRNPPYVVQHEQYGKNELKSKVIMASCWSVDVWVCMWMREREIFSRYRLSAEVSVWDFMVARAVKGIPFDVCFTFCLQTTNKNLPSESNNTKSISRTKKMTCRDKVLRSCMWVCVCLPMFTCACRCVRVFACLTLIERVCVLRMHSHTYCHIVQRYIAQYTQSIAFGSRHILFAAHSCV